MNLSIEAESFRPLSPPKLGDFKILVPLKLGGLGGNSYLHSATPERERAIAFGEGAIAPEVNNSKTSVRRVFSLRCRRLLPPKSPILGDFEPEILARSPPNLGDLGGAMNCNEVVEFTLKEVAIELVLAAVRSS